MPDWSTIDWSRWTTPETLGSFLRALLLVAIGFPLIRILTALVGKTLRKRVSDQSVMLVRKAIGYSCAALLLVMVLRELGFKLTALLGAAGIVGVAVGFASQTSLSNVVSGLFLISEKPFQVGDLIRIGDTTGYVQTIDLLSVKLRTLDNRFVRIPNESLIKTEVTNITRFPIRRMDFNIGVAYKEDIRRVMKVLRDVADKNPHCLDEPKPFLLFTGFGDSALELRFGVWFAKEDYVEVRNTILRDIKERFDAEGIEIPFPHRTLYAGLATEPFPVRLVGDGISEAARDAAVERADAADQEPEASASNEAGAESWP